MNNEIYCEEKVLTIEFYKTIIDRMLSAFAMHKIILDDRGNPCDYEFIDVNPIFETLTGLKKVEIIGKRISEVNPHIKEDSVDWIDIYGKVATKGEHISFENYSESIGKWFVINAYSPEKNYFITIFSDISQLKDNEIDLREKNDALYIAQKKLEHMVNHDYLTGLPNMASLIKEVNRYIQDTPNSKMAMLYIDSDNFKYINGTLGHPIGDILIKEIGNRLSALFQENQKVYSLGRDEFVVFLHGFDSDEEIKECAQMMLQGFKLPFELGDRTLYPTVSIGISVYPEHGRNANELLKNADVALHIAKDTGKNKFVFYNKNMYNSINQRLIMEKHLHTALENHEFEIYYQPQLNLSTNEICGFEALLRWNNPVLGSVPPSVFIEVAEANHLIIPIGKWVLRNACYFIKKLQNRGYKDIMVAVNVSVIQLMQEDFIDSVLTQLELIDLEPKYLEIEITESILVESYEVVLNKLKILRGNGIKISVDDFGKGYSSLSELHNLPIDILKIDKVFIDSILDQDTNNCITDMIIMLGRRMGLTVLAEGVETQEQMEYLIHNQCHIIQGYLFSKPVPEKEILAMLNKDVNKNINIQGFEWKDEYSINIEISDIQHKRLFEIGNRLSKLVFAEESADNSEDIAVILQELIDYTEYHFGYEESIMEEHGYVHLETHKNAHNLLIDRVNKSYSEMNNILQQEHLIDLIDMVAVWITNHILKEDKKFADFLSEKESMTTKE